MSSATHLIVTIKRLLRSRQITYRTLGQSLGLSEASVKRLFASERFTVDRLHQISELLGMTVVEMLQEAELTTPRLRFLTYEQEELLVSDEKLLLVTVCVLNHWSLTDILTAYKLSEAECIKYLLYLDKMGIVQLHPNNRIRLAVDREFAWLPGGPIRHSFSKQGLPEFFDSQFNAGHETMDFAVGMLTDAASGQLLVELGKVRSKLAALHESSSSAPLQDKRGISLLMAVRSWEPTAFNKYRRRPKKSKV